MKCIRNCGVRKMKNYLNKVMEIYIEYLKKLTSLRVFVVVLSFALLTKALTMGFITGSDYVKGIIAISSVYLVGRTITHFEKKNENG